MENGSELDLNGKLQAWRRHFSSNTTIRSEDLEELEAHLRDSSADLQKRGLTADEAVLIAARRLGYPTELDDEFTKCHGISEPEARAFWMLLGCFLYVAAMSLATIAAYFTLWCGGQMGLDGIRLGWWGLIARCMALGLMGWFGLHVLTRWGNSDGRKFARLQRHPLLAIFAVVAAALGLQVASSAIPNQVIFRTPTRVVGGFIGVDQLAGPLVIVAVLVLLIVSATKLRRIKRPATNVRSMWILALIGLLATGCNRQQSGPQEQETTPVAVEPQTAFEKCLAKWSSGNADVAVKDFLELDLRNGKLFSAGSALAMSETQFAAMPAAAREKLSSPMMAELQAIKELCKRVKEAGQQARTGGDSAKAAKCFRQIQTLGERLDQASVVLIGQKVGQALKRIAAE